MISGKVIPERRLVCLVLLFSLPAAADVSLDGLMQQFARSGSADARFREEKHLALLQSPLVLEGTLSYQVPDYLKKEILEPHHSLFEISGNSLHIETGSEQRTLSLDSHPLIRAFAESYRALLSGNGAALERLFDTGLTGSIEHWTLRLVPRDTQARAYIEAIVLSGSGGQIHSVETLESSGDTTLMTLMPAND
jgi:hypothetical protein